MNRIISISFVVGICTFLFLIFSFNSSARVDSVFNKFRVYSTENSISINSKKGTVTINNMEVSYRYGMKMIEKIIGKADRFIADTTTVYYEEFGLDGEPPVSFPKSVVNYYYVYDDLGLIFFSKGKQGSKNIMNRMVIKFGNERKFTNTEMVKYQPKKEFTGKLILNGIEIDPNSKLVPANVNYKTEEFNLFGTNFGPTSTATQIDCLYSIGSKVYMLFYLNDANEQNLSYLELK